MTSNRDSAQSGPRTTLHQPMDRANAESLLKEAKQILDDLGIAFFLRHGTCLGAVRDGGLIPWDDDLDIGSIIGMHGLTGEAVDRAVSAFRENGFTVEATRIDTEVSFAMRKSGTPMDWTCFHVQDGYIYQYPGVPIPARLHEDLLEIDFLGQRLHVPNPPEEYLRLKYGPNWSTPKRAGYQEDVLDLIPQAPPPGGWGLLRSLIERRVLRRRTGGLRVLNDHGDPVQGAEVVVAGVISMRTDRRGYAHWELPNDGYYALSIKYGDWKEVLYEETLSGGGYYVYRPDPSVTSGRIHALVEE